MREKRLFTANESLVKLEGLASMGVTRNQFLRTPIGYWGQRYERRSRIEDEDYLHGLGSLRKAW
jgi:hypothetical protein